MLTATTVFFALSLVIGFYMAWNIGANDVANAFGTSVGSGALTLFRAIILGGIFEFCGAFFVGANVADTIKGGIVPFEAFSDVRQLGVGMLAALLAAGVWLNVATFFGQPVSTTHAIIGAVIGFACVAVGPGHIKWANMGTIAASWIVSPLVGALLAYVVYRLIIRFVLRSRHPVYMARQAVPLCLAMVIFIITLSIVCAGPPKLAADRWMPSLLGETVFGAVSWLPPKLARLVLSLPLAVVLAALTAIGARMVIHRYTRNRRIRMSQRYVVVERWFGRIQGGSWRTSRRPT
ncbi:MAG: Sulfate permease CysP [Planctomycetes bacterium ADurb.Bin126]|nr:MAG: Sulfate permease CysP [Planctomycetes bacterium ADurb.Bin126]